MLAFTVWENDLTLGLDLEAKEIRGDIILEIVISNVLLLELEKDIKEREETLLFFLHFLLETKVKATSSVSSISTAISISGENVRIELGP